MIHESGGLDPYKDYQVNIVASKLYEQIRHRRTDIEHIANNTGFSIEQITIVKNYIFYDSHVLTSGYSRFLPSYEMAQSWLRLSAKTSSNIQMHDILLLYHELYEIELIISNSRYTQSHAHSLAEQKYNYSKACKEFYKR
jgi:hypothetical protein